MIQEINARKLLVHQCARVKEFLVHRIVEILMKTKMMRFLEIVEMIVEKDDVIAVRNVEDMNTNEKVHS